jgi:hypothetical protein
MLCLSGILGGEFPHPLKIIALHPNGTWRDVSGEIAWSVAKAAAADGDVLPDGPRDFLAGQSGS